MRDLDNELDALREGLLETVHAPDFPTVVARSRQRTSRRVRQLGAVVAVLLVGAAIPVLRSHLGPASETPQPATVSGTVPGWIPLNGTPFVYNVRWNDVKHGYALRGICTGEETGPACLSELLLTEDGQQWHPRALPGPRTPGGTGASWTLYVLGQSRIVVDGTAGRYYSDDSGQNWREVPVEPRRTVPAIPDRAVLLPRCPVSTAACRDAITVLLPDSGESATLAAQPPLTEITPGTIRAGDGNWWASGKDPATGGWALAVSRDAGGTWLVAPVPEFAGIPANGLTVVATRTVRYAAAVGPRSGADDGLLAIFRSTDGGQSWERTWQAADGAEPRTINGVPIAATDGTLLVSTESGTLYSSTDGGRTFGRSEGLLGRVEWHNGGYFAQQEIPSNLYEWSPDGVNWTRLFIG